MFNNKKKKTKFRKWKTIVNLIENKSFFHLVIRFHLVFGE